MGYLPEIEDAPAAESLATLKRNSGLAPNFYRAQLLRPDLVDAQVKLLDQLLFSKGTLSRVQKEFILLAVSAENNNAYFPASEIREHLKRTCLTATPARCFLIRHARRCASSLKVDRSSILSRLSIRW